MTTEDYLELLDWTARQVAPGKAGHTPDATPPILERLNLRPAVWQKLVMQFGALFSVVAGQPHRVDDHRGCRGQHYYLPAATRQLLCA